MVQTLARPVSDHIPYVLQIKNGIPKSKVFRFENFWWNIASFLPTVQQLWNVAPFSSQPAKNLNSKLKNFRQGFKRWSWKFSNLNQLINNFILPDIKNICEQFYQGSVNLQPINSSFITLIPKNNDPETVNDYRQISLLNCSIKLLTKLLANRLQSVMT